MTKDTDREEDLEVLTLDEGARLLRVNPKTLRDAVARGEIPARRVGKLIRLNRSALQEWFHGPTRNEAGR